MYKVITISSHYGFEKTNSFIETEYPQLNKYLEDGYAIKETIPIIKQSDPSFKYAITFVLFK